MSQFDSNCPFCQKIAQNKHIMFKNNYAVAFMDIKPSNPGHMLVVPIQHTHTIFDCNSMQVLAIHDLINKCKQFLDKTFHPGGYNIGINSYPIGGQSIQHCHVHIIPRYVKQRRQQKFPHDKSWHAPQLLKYTNPAVQGSGVSSYDAWHKSEKLFPELKYRKEDVHKHYHHEHHFHHSFRRHLRRF